MPKCTDAKIDFGRFGRRVIEADFSGGDLGSDGGLLLLRQSLLVPPNHHPRSAARPRRLIQ